MQSKNDKKIISKKFEVLLQYPHHKKLVGNLFKKLFSGFPEVLLDRDACAVI